MIQKVLLLGDENASFVTGILTNPNYNITLCLSSPEDKLDKHVRERVKELGERCEDRFKARFSCNILQPFGVDTHTEFDVAMLIYPGLAFLNVPLDIDTRSDIFTYRTNL
eukprot:GHVL01006788.1.p1 GENE.GHVL01006788.1~~GHVL01006788.1.p1  ORF type:complete len:120 (-),score=24.50 GHVL01006788.1:219-548(-)